LIKTCLAKYRTDLAPGMPHFSRGKMSGPAAIW